MQKQSLLQKQIESSLPTGMTLPDPLKLLFAWIEQKGFYEDNDKYRVRFGYLQDPVNSPDIGTSIIIWPDRNKEFGEFPDKLRDIIRKRLYVFARSGADGSEIGLWLDSNQKQKIVHIGSGSGSTLMCVLADDPIDFLRLLAIGYEEICWDEDFAEPPGEESLLNEELRNWVEYTFSTNIPKTALEIVKYPARMDDTSSKDEFWNFIKNLWDQDDK